MSATIVVECDNDELLLKTLGIPKARILHEGNRDEVVKYIVSLRRTAYCRGDLRG